MVTREQKKLISLDEILAEKHWINKLYDEIPNPEKAQELLKNEKKVNGLRGKATTYISDIVQQRLDLKARKENILKEERKVWGVLQQIQIDRHKMEQEIINKKKQKKKL